MDRVLMLRLQAQGCAAEVLLNDVPVGRVGPAGGTLCLPVHEYLLAGDNEISMVINPPPIANPKPVPVSLVEKYGSNIFDKFSSGIPPPVSVISTLTNSSASFGAEIFTIRFPPVTSIACIAFIKRLLNTDRRNSASPWICGTFSSSVKLSLIPQSPACPSTIRSESSTTFRKSVGCKLALTGRE